MISALPLRFLMFLKAFVILALGVASTNATGGWSTTRTDRIGPDARTYRWNLQRKTVEALKTTMTAVATHAQNIARDEQHSVYTGFSITATSAEVTVNAHHHQSNYAFGGEVNRCTCWYEYCVEYTGEDMESIATNKFLETFFINQTPKVSNVLECPFLIS